MSSGASTSHRGPVPPLGGGICDKRSSETFSALKQRLFLTFFARELDLTPRFLEIEQLVLFKQRQQPPKDWPRMFSDYCRCATATALVEVSVLDVIGACSALLAGIRRQELFVLYEPFLEDGPAISTILDAQGLSSDERVLVITRRRWLDASDIIQRISRQCPK